MARRYGNYSWQRAARYGRRSDKWRKSTSKSISDVSPTPTLESYESALKNSKKTEKILKNVKPIEGLEEMTFSELSALYKKMYINHYTRVKNNRMLQEWTMSKQMPKNKENALYKIDMLNKAISINDARTTSSNNMLGFALGLFVIIVLVIAFS